MEKQNERELLFSLLKEPKLAHYDWGSVKMMRPTGRYTDASENGNLDGFEPRLRYIVEVKEPGFFGAVRWLPVAALKRVQRISDR